MDTSLQSDLIITHNLYNSSYICKTGIYYGSFNRHHRPVSHIAMYLVFESLVWSGLLYQEKPHLLIYSYKLGYVQVSE